MKPDEAKQPTRTDKPDPQAREERGAETKPAKIDFAKLDLSVEKVEERISPSETNVFDK
jgi:hypothetical protein